MKNTRDLFLDIEAPRLRNQFGSKNFSDDKLRIFWNELKDLSHQEITRIVDELISNYRFSPTRNELCELISKTREFNHDQIKRKQYHELNRNFKPEEHSKILGVILKCVIENDMERLTSMAKKITPALRSCLKCGGDGVATAYDEKRNEYAFKCDCEAGREGKEAWPMWGGKSSMGLTLKFGPIV